MIEVERKVRADHDAVRERLAASEADLVDRRIERDTYYDHPTRDFAQTDEALRIRRTEPVPDHEDGTSTADDAPTGTELTYKGPKVDDVDKTRRELSTGVDDPNAIDATLQALGFTPVATVTKDRTAFDLGECRLTLDAVEDVGSFVEVEVQVPDEEPDAVTRAREQCVAALADVGLADATQVRTSYLGLLLDGDDASAN